MLIRGILAILSLATFTLLVLAFYFDNSTLGLIAFPLLIGVAIIYTFKPQIDWWYFSRNTPDLETPIVELFKQQLPDYYQKKSIDQQLKFRQKTFMCQLGVDWKMQEKELKEAPEDISSLIASQFARVLPNQDDYLLGKFEKVILYRHPFPSPNYPKLWHSSELFAEDGVILLSIEQAIPGIVNPKQHFNLALYEIVRAANISGITTTPSGLKDWKTIIKEVTGHSSEWVEKSVGIPDLDNVAIHKVLEMEFGDDYQMTLGI